MEKIVTYPRRLNLRPKGILLNFSQYFAPLEVPRRAYEKPHQEYYYLIPEIAEWCKENISGKMCFYESEISATELNVYLCFDLDRDHVAFKMRWC